MANWYAAGDETGTWDIIDGRFGSKYIGVAWVLGSGHAWERALTMAHNGATRLQTFTTPFATRFPTHRVEVESQYHVKNVWDYCRNEHIAGDIPLDAPHADPVVEALRSDAAWLLKESGLAVLASGDKEAHARAAGLGDSGDHMRERARAMAALFGVALPFIPENDTLILLPEGRKENWESDILRATGSKPPDGDRRREPYRDFLGRLREDIKDIAQRCLPLLDSGKIVGDIRFADDSDYIDSVEREEFNAAARKEFPLLRSKKRDTMAAMSALADMAAALARGLSGQQGLVVPAALERNLWTGSLGEVIRGFR